MRKGTCDGIETDLTAFHQGELPGARADEVRAHLEACGACARALDEVRAIFDLAGEVEDLAPSLRLKRNLAALARRESRRVPEEAGFLAGVRAAGAFLLHRMRTSGRFRLAAVSVTAHVVLLLLVSLVVIPQVVKEGPAEIGVRWDASIPAGKELQVPDTAPSSPPAPLPEIPASTPEIVHTDPYPRPRGSVDLGPVAPLLPAPNRPVVQPLAGLFANALEPDVRARRAAACFSDPEGALASVEKGLGWLAREQEDDGSWAPAGRGPEYRTGVTAAAVLAFLSDGHSEARGAEPFRRAVSRAIDRLLADQQEDGDRAGLIGPANGHFAYNHALATLALVEAYAVDYRRVPEERTLRVRRAVRAAVEYIRRQQADAGAWPYGGGANAAQTDTSVAIFTAMALASARSARFPVPERTFDGFTRWLRSVTGENGVVGYRIAGDRDEHARTLTAGALHMEEILGLAAPLRDLQAELVRADLRDPNRTKRNSLLRFYAALAFRARGEMILEGLRGETVALQRPDGSWDSSGDEWAAFGGDAFLTALNVLTLTSAFRFPA